MDGITFVYSYFKNGGMFQIQQQNWNSYPDETKNSIEVIVTDDCSPDDYGIEKNIVRPAYPSMRLFKIDQKVPWNWLQCRNIGARFAKHQWLLLTDMDHMVVPDVARSLLEMKKDTGTVYMLRRNRAVDGLPYKPHDDSFFVHRDVFWGCGGYDEHFSGHYGTSGMFRRRLFDHAKANVRIKQALILYGREVVPDASTTDFVRKSPDRPKDELRRLRAGKKGDRCVHFRFPYKEIEF